LPVLLLFLLFGFAPFTSVRALIFFFLFMCTLDTISVHVQVEILQISSSSQTVFFFSPWSLIPHEVKEFKLPALRACASQPPSILMAGNRRHCHQPTTKWE
jgi:hypothetical protein